MVDESSFSEKGILYQFFSDIAKNFVFYIRLPIFKDLSYCVVFEK